MNHDCIDRQATLDAIIKRLGINNESYLLPAERTIYQQIKDMPSVTLQEQKIGHWLYIDERKAKCSRCKYIQITGGADKTGHCNIHYGVYKYCTNCGAKMESEDKNVSI